MVILKSCSVDSDASATGFVPEEIDLGDDVLAEIILRLPLDSVARSSSRPVYACAGEAAGSRPGTSASSCCTTPPPSDGCNGLLLCRDPGATEFYVVSLVMELGSAPEAGQGGAALRAGVRPGRRAALLPRDQLHRVARPRRGGGGVLVGDAGVGRARRGVRRRPLGLPLRRGALPRRRGVLPRLRPGLRRPHGPRRRGRARVHGHRPPEPADGDGRVAHSGGRLHYCSDGGLLKVWSLEDGRPRPRWRLMHAVRVSDVVEVGGGGEGEVRFLAMHPENQAVVYIWSPWKVVEYDLGKREMTGAAWEFGKGARNRVVKAWLVPSSCYLSDCFADDGLALALNCSAWSGEV
ncbi:hypothetical protein ZWY2020_048411 [Hordeum vulgare]|nr:hypothetical protein ZWY2020_048411 [Hordeum vulgare]